VVRVVDGDTLVVELAGREVPVRLIGIDTPETVAPGRPVECYGAEASDHLRALAPAGTAVRLERDVEARDMYDRLLAYVYRSGDGLLLNRAQVDGGFAEADDHPPNTALRSELHAAEAAAPGPRGGAAGRRGGGPGRRRRPAVRLGGRRRGGGAAAGSRHGRLAPPTRR